MRISTIVMAAGATLATVSLATAVTFYGFVGPHRGDLDVYHSQIQATGQEIATLDIRIATRWTDITAKYADSDTDLPDTPAEYVSSILPEDNLEAITQANLGQDLIDVAAFTTHESSLTGTLKDLEDNYKTNRDIGSSALIAMTIGLGALIIGVDYRKKHPTPPKTEAVVT